jgi:hypothetical protein
MNEHKNNLNESSLSRLWRHNEKHDSGALTAFRKGPDCGECSIIGEDAGLTSCYSKKQNAQRNKSLLAKLKSKGYSVTKLHGSYPEGGKTAKEISYFVVDINNKGTLEKDLRKLGQEFEQDSVLYVPKGAIQNKSKAELIGTNHCENNWLGFGKKEVFNKGRMGYDSPIYTSKVNGRPFIFEEVGGEVLEPASGMGIWAMHIIANKKWEDIDI